MLNEQALITSAHLLTKTGHFAFQMPMETGQHPRAGENRCRPKENPGGVIHRSSLLFRPWRRRHAVTENDQRQRVRLALRLSLDVSDIVFDRIIDQSKKSDPMGFGRGEGDAVEVVGGIPIALN